MNIYDLVDLAEATALDSKLNPTEESTWRSIERLYSKMFSTPLHLVSTLDPLEVIIALEENKFDSLNIQDDEDLNKILDRLYSLQDPEYDANREKEEEEYNKQAVKEEEQRLAKIAAKNAKKTEQANPAVDPKKGGINLAYLAQNQENEG